MKKKIKRAMTLLEVMIVIFIIGLIGSVIGYNMRGSLDQGKAFKTREGINKLYHLIHLEMDSREIQEKQGSVISQAVLQAVENSGLVSNPNSYLRDGWGNDLKFKVVEVEGSYEIHMTSERYEQFCEKKNKPTDYPWQQEDDR